VAELLVHVSAKQEDDNHRRRAASYADFQLDRIEAISVASRVLTTQDLDQDDIPTHLVAAPVFFPPEPLSSVVVNQTPTPAHAPTSFLFTELSPLFSTAAPHLAPISAAEAISAHDRTEDRQSSEEYISDTPLAVQALESQLWASSLVAQAHNESKDDTDVEDEFTRSSPLDAPSAVERPAAHVSLSLDRAAEPENGNDTTVTMIVRPSNEEPASGKQKMWSPQDATLSQKKRKHSEDRQEERRQTRRTSLELDELRHREPSSSPISPSQEPDVDAFGNLVAPPQHNALSKDDTRRYLTTPAKHLPTTADTRNKPVSSASVVSASLSNAHFRNPSPVAFSKVPASATQNASSTRSSVMSHRTFTTVAPQNAPGVVASVISQDTVIKSNVQLNPAMLHTNDLEAPQHVSAKTVSRLGAATAKEQQSTQAPPAAVSNGARAPAVLLPHASIATLSTSHFTIAPSPPVSIAPGPAHPSATITHITPALQHLHDKFALVQPPRYAPLSQSRPLRPLERGYWYMPASSTTVLWNMELVQDLWTWLEEFIASGQAGWGIMLARVPANCSTGNAIAEADRSGEGGQELRQDLRLYCWGEVVEHIYDLLFVASRSKVKKAGLRWIDGAGAVVVQMP
jgi:hypothetical protein